MRKNAHWYGSIERHESLIEESRQLIVTATCFADDVLCIGINFVSSRSSNPKNGFTGHIKFFKLKYHLCRYDGWKACRVFVWRARIG